LEEKNVASSIEINGRKYDALTGLPLGAIHKPITGKVISDIAKPHHKPAPVMHPTQPSVAAAKKPATTSKAKATARPIGHLKAHKPEAAKTLVRFAVKKPQPSSSKAFVRVHTPIGSSAVTQHHTTHKPVLRADSDRLARSRMAPASHLIQHFSKESAHPIVPNVAPIKVKSPEVGHSIATTNTKRSPQQEQFEQALRSATSHNQKILRRPRQHLVRFSNRFVAVSVGVIAIIIIGGFVLTQNMPQIDVHLASMHAGFQAQLPSYQPAGFAFMSHVQAATDKIVLSYHSTTDERQFSIAQQVSTWSDHTLHAYVASTGQPLLTTQDNGHNVYLYGNHLTWVNNGVWYQITNHADLSYPQLLNIATSM
jgi:hypothetical protein